METFNFLFKNKLINIQKILLETYSKLNINEEEVIVLMKLFDHDEINSKSLNKIEKTISLDTNKLFEIINNLLKKKFIELELEYTDSGREKECYSLKPTIEKIYNLFFINEDENNDNIQKIIPMFEHHLGRGLSPIEIQKIMFWINEDKLSEKEIFEAIELAVLKNKVTVNYVDGILLSKTKEKKSPIKKEESKMLVEDFYKLWKK